EISDELYREESARIKRERINAETSLAQTNIRYDELKEFLALRCASPAPTSTTSTSAPNPTSAAS
ncbi:MAG TPA: hypothetical protein VID70_11145, partial [Solirubrobacteraceae bacterium]